MGKSYYQQLPLAPLGPDAIRELLGALLGSDPSTAGLAEVIHARTAGNPFFTEEVVQNLIETRKLRGAKGAYKLVTPIDKLEVPSTVHALLAARIDRLSEREKDVLQTAAVIGREFDEPTLAAVVGVEASPLREALQKLKDTEFIREQSLYPVAEYLFKHPLTQEVALTSQLQERRRKLHAAVARVIEAAHSADLDQQAALLAHHWEQAADSQQAVHWHRRAAEWAGANDPVEGLRHWRKVHELSASLTDRASKESRLRACCAILSGSWRFGMSDDDARRYLDETRALADELGDSAAMAVALGGLANQRGARGDLTGAIELATEARGMLNDRMTLDEVMQVEGSAYWLNAGGRLSLALEGFERIIRLSGGDPQKGRGLIGFSPLIWAERLTGRALSEIGDFDACWPRAERAVRLAREDGAQELLAFALGSLGMNAYLAGGTSRVPVPDLRRACVEGVELAGVVGSRYTQLFAGFLLATAHFLSADFTASEELFAETLALARAEGTALEYPGFFLAVWADSCLARGDVEAAIAKAREGIELSDSGGMWFQGALARAALVDALVHANAPEQEIRNLLAQARELVSRSGGNSLLPRLREAEARLEARSDATLLAAGLREAEAMYRAMGAPDPADRLARELAA
jgi:adenylate cyclase